MSNLKDHAEYELGLLGEDEDGMQSRMNNNILEVVDVIASQNHSGFSLSYMTKTLNELLNFRPLTTLKGTEDEWRDVTMDGDEDIFEQNVRDSSVFRYNKDNDTAHTIHAYTFSDDGGESWYTCSDSLENIEFPYKPVPAKRVTIDEDGNWNMLD